MTREKKLMVGLGLTLAAIGGGFVYMAADSISVNNLDNAIGFGVVGALCTGSGISAAIFLPRGINNSRSWSGMPQR